MILHIYNNKTNQIDILNLKNNDKYKDLIEILDTNKTKIEKELLDRIDNSNHIIDLSIYNYLLGYINTLSYDTKKSAKIYLLNSINLIPISQAYYHYSNIEDDKNVAINYLNKGKAFFPNDIQIYLGLIVHSHKNDKIKIIQEIKSKKISDVKLLSKCIEVLITYDDWIEIMELSNIILNNNSINKDYRNYFNLILAYSLLLSKNISRVQKSLKIFNMLITEDISNKLEYSHYMGIIGCYIELNQINEVSYYFDKLKVNNCIVDLIGKPKFIIMLDLYKVYMPIFDSLSNIFSKDKNRKQKNAALKALYLYNSYYMFGNIKLNKRNINDLERYYKKHSENLEVGCALYSMKYEKKLYLSAYSTFMIMLNNYLEPSKLYASLDCLFEKCSPSDLETIIEDIKNKINEKYDMDMTVFIPEVFDMIIDKLWNIKSYKAIAALSNFIKEPYLNYSHKLFEIAYSYTKENNNDKAKPLYESLVKKKPNFDSAYNNLGVICEGNGDLTQAKKLYSKAHDIDESEKLYYDNLQRVNALLEKYAKAFKLFKKEPTWFVGRVEMLYDTSNTAGIIQCTYKNRPKILKVSPNKANELIDKMLEYSYITKITNNDSSSPSAYKINPLIKNHIRDIRSRIEDNKQYEKIADNINIDNIETVGYTPKVISLLQNIHNEELQIILERDLRECAICLLSQQSKATIIMSGSIIEAILMSKILELGLTNYDIGTLLNKSPKTKKVKDMNMNELIEIAKEKKLIKTEHFHLTHYLRCYRNIIHPACEIRNQLDVSYNQATLMWNILLSVIKSILPNP